MIRIATLFADHLNLNGDQANLSVLKQLLEHCAVSVEIVNVTSEHQLAKLDANLVFIGHGSQAAHSAINGELAQLVKSAKASGRFLFFVGSGVEFAVENKFATGQQIVRAERESKFDIGELGELKVLGYRNTDSSLPNLWLEENSLFCMLHGPVLAKNPKLLNWLAKQITEFEITETAKAWLEKVNQISRRIWELETEVEFERLELN